MNRNNNNQNTNPMQPSQNSFTRNRNPEFVQISNPLQCTIEQGLEGRYGQIRSNNSFDSPKNTKSNVVYHNEKRYV